MLALRLAPVLAIGAALCVGNPAHAQTINANFACTGSAGATAQNSAAAAAAGAAFVWQVNVQEVIANGTIFGQPIPLPLTSYGVSWADMGGAGTYSGLLPGVLWSHRYTFTDVGAATPTYDFTFGVTLNADRTATAQLTVHSLSMFTAGGITGSPVPVPVSSITVNGNVQVSTVVPAPGSIALFGAGAVLAIRRRR